MAYHRFVALGDSCTEGIDDPYPDGTGYRGWADLVAQRLAQRTPGLRYANLAVRGRRIDQIYAEQIATARQLQPDLVSVLGGANDVLQGGWDAERVADNLHGAVREMTAVARTVLVFTLPDLPWRRIPGRKLRPRIAYVNSVAEDAAVRFGAILIDLRDHPATHDRRYFGPDRLHLGESGHRLLAAYVMEKLGLDPDPQWLVDPPDEEPHPRWHRVVEDARWVRTHAAPAAVAIVRNRMIGREPGDGFLPKRPELRTVI